MPPPEPHHSAAGLLHSWRSRCRTTTVRPPSEQASGLSNPAIFQDEPFACGTLIRMPLLTRSAHLVPSTCLGSKELLSSKQQRRNDETPEPLTWQQLADCAASLVVRRMCRSPIWVAWRCGPRDVLVWKGCAFDASAEALLSLIMHLVFDTGQRPLQPRTSPNVPQS